MKNKINLLLFTLLIGLIFPIISNAANIELRKTKSDKNIVSYDVIYKLDEGEEELSTYILKVYNENDDLTYNITSNYAADNNSCNLSNCAMIFTTPLNEAGKEYIIASINVTNETNEPAKTTLRVEGFDAGKKEFTVNALTSTTTTTTMTTTKAVPNNNLSNLTVSNGVIDQAFNKDINKYNVTGILDTVPTVKVTPTCETECIWTVSCPLGECSVVNASNESSDANKSATVSLQTGANTVSVTVYSKDKSINKTYTINIYRGEIETSSAYLTDIIIKDAELSPKFDSMTNDYTTTVTGDVDTLEITTTPEDPEAKIQIKGNENLAVGENTITITVTSSDGENKQVYTIIVTKEETKEEEKFDEEEKDVPIQKVEKKKNNLWLIILLSVLTLALIIVIFLIIFKKKKNKNNKNDKNDKNGGKKNKDNSAIDLVEQNDIEKENTESLNILNETRRQLKEEPKQDIDEALDDLMMTKRLELGDLGL